MTARATRLAAAALAIAILPVTADGQETRTLAERLDAVEVGLAAVGEASEAGRDEDARRAATRVYLDEFEAIEGHWGPHGSSGTPGLADTIAVAEATFHALMRAEGSEVAPLLDEAWTRIAAIRSTAEQVGALGPPAAVESGPPAPHADESENAGPSTAETAEIADLLAELDRAEAAWRSGDRRAALAGVERAYLQGFEPLEPRLPSDAVGRIERTFHLELRPALARGVEDERVGAAFARLDRELLDLDRALEAGGSFWFTATSSFAIIVREGLEAVLLIGAILAYLARVSGDRRHARQVWAGVWVGVAASVGTWIVARTLIPLGGAGRELIEGVTALLAVVVLLYVSHWLFQKTYIHGWKEYLRERVDVAVGTGSSLAMAGLAFAAVYREGFETVLFYQALLTDTGASAVAAGFVPGLIVILAVGAGVLRLGLRLPLGRVFGITNAILLALAFVFLGKGIYNLQEAGLFAAHPVPWMPDHGILRQVFGLYPITETLLAQLAFAVVIGATYVWHSRRRSREVARLRPREAAVR